ncbi:hypothetical protein QNH46_15760 [Paenibacillus woosongensis]|uniref:Secreted protein n=1 Tax=Paenibacillus woosongensis TaxID=307580 RepID=A0AA95L025_9BACL|nr:hypothetical protein [Paenibacillus woosongensis]WHX47604.1 hypothetical protein QNH46_15760 [Paenibacillus woosongensis]
MNRKSLLTFTLALLISIISVLPASAAAPNDFYDTSPKYVEIVRLIHFDKGGDSSIPPSSYFYITYFPAGRFSGTLQMNSTYYTIISNDGSGYHEVTYKGYVYFRPNGP